MRWPDTRSASQVMHITWSWRKKPFPESPSPKDFQSTFLPTHHIMEGYKTYAKLYKQELYKVRMKVLESQERHPRTSRETISHQFAYWHGGWDILGHSMLNSGWVQLSQKGWDHKLSPYRHMQILTWQMDEKPFENRVNVITHFWNTTCWPDWTMILEANGHMPSSAWWYTTIARVSASCSI